MSNQEQVKQLLKNVNQFVLNGQDDIGRTPLMLAASKGFQSIAELLLVEKGALLECEDMFGRTVIHHTAASGDTKLFDFFRDQGAKIDHLSDAGYHALHAAVYSSQRKMIVHLMDQLDPSKVTIDGETCLSLCENKDCFYVVRDLLCQSENPLFNAHLEFILPNVPTSSLLDRALICFASSSQPDWSSLPAMGLDWHEVNDPELARKWISCFDQADMEDNDEIGTQRTFWRYGLFGIRIAKLPFYSKCLLVDMKLNAFFNHEYASKPQDFVFALSKFLGILSSLFSPLHTWQTSKLAFAFSQAYIFHVRVSFFTSNFDSQHSASAPSTTDFFSASYLRRRL